MKINTITFSGVAFFILSSLVLAQDSLKHRQISEDRCLPWSGFYCIGGTYGRMLSEKSYLGTIRLWEGKTSIDISKDYSRFGIGAALLESIPSDTTERLVSWIPIYIYFVPYVKFKKWKLQPVERTEKTAKHIIYYYYPSKTVNREHVIKMINLYAGGSAWAINSEDSHLFGKEWYLNSGISLIHFFKISNKPMFLMDIWQISINCGILTFPSQKDNSLNNYTYITVELAISYLAKKMWR